MTKVPKSYPASLKTQVSLAAIREEGSLAELSARFGVSSKIISRWKQEALHSIESRFSSKTAMLEKDCSEQIKELHAKIGALVVERDFLAEASSRLTLAGGKK